MESVLNGKQLKAIAHKSHTATVVATSLACRDRLRHESDITRTKNALIRDGEKIVEADYMQFWKDLQLAGAGSIVYGRKGKPDRFTWNYSLKKVAESMIEGRDVQASREEVSKPVETKAVLTPGVIVRKAELKSVPKEIKSDASGVVSEMRVIIALRPGFTLDFKVPSDISTMEVEQISRTLGGATR